MTIISCLATAHQSRETTQAGNPCVCISSFRGSLKEIQSSLHAILPLRNAFSPFLLRFLFKSVAPTTTTPLTRPPPGKLANTRAELSREGHTEIYFSLLRKREGNEEKAALNDF